MGQFSMKITPLTGSVLGGNQQIKLEIDAEVASGLDRATVRTLVENATTLGFIEKVVK